jgi:hypothetical protein
LTCTDAASALITEIDWQEVRPTLVTLVAM